MNESQVNLRYFLHILSSPPGLIEFQSLVVAKNAAYTFELHVPELSQDTDLDVTIIPNLYDLGLNGSAVLTHVRVGK